MKYDALYSAFQNDNADRAFLQELHERLDVELQKPFEERDFDLIEECTEAITTMEGMESMIQEHSSEAILQLQQQNRRSNITQHRNPLRKRCWISACACAAIIIGANIWSVAALEHNIFTATVQWFQGGFNITMPDPEQSIAPADEDDLYGMKAECEKYGFTPLTPTYLPEGLVLKHTEVITDAQCSKLIFYYTNQKKDAEQVRLNVHFYHYNSAEDVQPIGLSSDNTEPKEEIMGNATIWTLEEDDQVQITFLYENTVYLISGHGISGEECRKITASLVSIV